MANDDWFRGAEWDEAAQTLFREKLRRARDQKWFYMRVKAAAIAQDHPDDAIALLDEYIAADERHGPGGHYAKANIALARGNRDDAFAELDAAMGRDGQALGAAGVMENAFLSALYCREDRYERALSLFEPWDASARQQLGRPFSRSFAGNFGEALIFHALGRREDAEASARAALEQQMTSTGPIAGHPTLGLPPRIDDTLTRQLIWIAGLWDREELGDPPTEFGVP